jgi:hypothetical protein
MSDMLAHQRTQMLCLLALQTAQIATVPVENQPF